MSNFLLGFACAGGIAFLVAFYNNKRNARMRQLADKYADRTINAAEMSQLKKLVYSSAEDFPG